MAVLSQILVALAVAILRWWANREDIKTGERGRLALAAAEAAQRALAWKATHPVAPGPDPVGDFRVHDRAEHLRVSPSHPRAPDAERDP